jgi:phosphatidylglycerophosphate synthase
MFLVWIVLGIAMAVALRNPDLRAWPRGRFGVANTLTALRVIIVVLLPALPRLWMPGAVLVFLALDSIDGKVARARGEASKFGAAFDMETDALCVLVVSLLLWQLGAAGAWVLVAGLWRYVYVALVAVIPSLSEAPRSNIGRVVYALMMLAFAFALWPSRYSSAAAAVGTILVSLSFLHSLNASRSSRAASDQLRAGGRAR